ncbi:MAG: pyrimidine/purine nucleoside phosphorylase [Spirochaetaceae bacterium]|nr:pyrimidine/purine nucleoside phosphorylase [Spirochaetaceae bacterium]
MKHSSYFDGKVQSLGVNTKNGYATVGVIEPGSYTFSTSTQETMVVVEGVLKYRLYEQEWMEAKKGEKFVVAPGVAFDCRADVDTAYICYYK